MQTHQIRVSEGRDRAAAIRRDLFAFPEVIDVFQKHLIERGIPTFVRHSRGRDVMAACGQLALNELTSASPLPVLR